MALKISIETSKVGVPFTDAYARITHVVADKNQCQYYVIVSASEEARVLGAMDVASHAFYCATPTGNLMESLYADLKQQVGFENAKDC
jgi:hypothetical protein